MKRGVKTLCVALALGVVASTAVVSNSSDVVAATGKWQHNAKGYWYSYSDGTYAKNQWLQIGGKWYYFTASGYMHTGWLQKGWNWYFLNPANGAMVTGWGQSNGKWYYFNPSGVMQTGWRKISGKWYFFNTNGIMTTGWKKINDQWYYFNAGGAMVTGEQTIGGVKYYFNSNGQWIDQTSAYKVGDIVKFGKYEQNNSTSDGAEAIEWKVLAKSGKAILVQSVNALDCVPYNETSKGVTWETCSLRTWLNEDFYNAAFTAAEQKKIQPTTLTNSNNNVYSVNGGKATTDKIYVLSQDEVIRYGSMVKDDDGNYHGNVAACKPSSYCKARGAWISTSGENKGSCWYWLRTPGMTQDYASTVDYDGYLSYGGKVATGKNIAVRPVMWITP